ncbi:MAG: Competence ComEA helix-hairpin-helix repeat region domain protein [Acidobacteria bacterium]|nr:Competence ComEA helix-hairpin-helix repeat region domain protein [Acidobacteriota bacterium]
MRQSLLQARTTRLVYTTLIAALTLIVLSCVKLPRQQALVSERSLSSAATSGNPGPARININSASTAELEKLPGIGQVIAARIVAYREHYGPFRRAEHLMMVRGFSDTKFCAIRDLVTLE